MFANILFLKKEKTNPSIQSAIFQKKYTPSKMAIYYTRGGPFLENAK